LWSSLEAHIISSKSENKDTQKEELGAMTQSTGYFSQKQAQTTQIKSSSKSALFCVTLCILDLLESHESATSSDTN
jgi:hypothetical protein